MPDRKPDATSAATELSPVKRALLEIRNLRARVEELESARDGLQQPGEHEPIAIIGAGLRFPGGVVDEASFWDLLEQGKDAITEIPRERWDWRAYFNPDPDAAGSMYTQHGGFLNGVDLFDAAFFGISPREAVAMDPQHRLALEVGWEALENAGYSPAAFQGSSTGVFLGIANNDYGRAAMADLDRIDAYTGSGNSLGMVAGRLSYVLGLHGPSLVIDTACSASLVAVHLACMSLRAGECSVALAGGANLILSPESNVALSKAHMMARDGHCKTFDEAADGYVRSEGCCIIVLKKLSDAVSASDRILAVVRGSAVNHDGRSGGLTAPNGPAQAAVMRKALKAAGVNAGEVGYVETHGTGTALGDPIEVETLAAVMGSERSPENPLAIGAVKTNIGHTEAASGVAGLMKTVLALRHHEIPPSLHLNKKNLHIGWDRIPVVVPTEVSEWKLLNGHRYAGVSSFGFSGTNAHVVLEEAPALEITRNPLERRKHILTVSARTQSALDALCGKYVDVLRACAIDDSGEGLADLCFTANTGRTHFAHRVAVVGETAEQMAAELERAGKGTSSSRMFTGNVEDAGEQRIGYLFTGQGSQYAGMGRELYASSPVFRDAIERCALAWKEVSGESLIEVLYPAEASRESADSGMSAARNAQATLFAFEYALAELWRSWGVEPSVLLGHSLGEYVAAVVAGVFSLEDGLRLVHARARLMDTLTRPGAMLAIAATAERVRAEIAGLEKEVAIATINAPESVVLSGAAETVARVAKKLEAEGIRSKALAVTHAFHSPLLEPILDEFEEIAGKVKYHAPRIRMISNLTGETARAEEITTARYWREHMRGTVLFDAGLQAALATGCRTFLEIGPQPHLKALAIHGDESLASCIKISFRKQRPEWDQMLETLGALYVEGQKIDWNGFDRGYRRIRVALPTYPFERQRYWLSSSDGDSSQEIWRRSTAAAQVQSNLVPIGLDVGSLAAKQECIERWAVAEMLQTLRTFGAFAKPEIFYDAKSLAQSCGILPVHVKLMDRWLNLLCEAGYLDREGAGYRNRAPLPDVDAASAWREVETEMNGDPFLLRYLGNCAKHLQGVLLGTTSPLETLFPGGSPELARNLYENSVGPRYANRIVAAAAQAACAAAPANRRVRIIELGAGTGATTSAVLPTLPTGRVSYTFTDISEVFLQGASTRFSQYPFVKYGLLDIEDEKQLAGYAGFFDIVIAANVVHATRDLRSTLSGIERLLTTGGTLVLLESTKNMAWHDITTGLIEGWQKSEDEIRGTKALLGVDDWDAALRHAGFEEVFSAPEAGSPAGDIGLHVMMARRSADKEHADKEKRAFPNIAPQNTWVPVAGSNILSTDGSLNMDSSAPAIDALLQDAPPSEHRAILLDVVCKEIARVLRLPADATPKKQERLMDMGLDSLMAVELRNRLAASLGLESLPATLIFDYPTPDAIAGYLLDRVQKKTPQLVEASLPQPPVQEKMLTAEEVASLPEEDIAALLRSRLSR